MSFVENCLLGDFNGDGKADFARNVGKGAIWEIFLNIGAGWERHTYAWVDLAKREARNVCFSRESGFQKTELVCSRTDSVFERIRSAGQYGHLVREIVNTLGGRTALTYVSSATLRTHARRPCKSWPRSRRTLERVSP